jgi:hypothetical protein
MLAAPAGADALQLAVRPGFGGAVKVGTWVPVELEIQNTGAATSGEVQVQVDAQTNRGTFNRPPVIYRAAVELPSRARKRLTLDIFIPSVDEKLRAQVVAGGQTVSAQEVAFERVAAGELFCGVLTGGRTSLDFLGATDLGGPYRRPRLVGLDVSDIPTSPHLLQSLDCLIMSNVSTASLVDSQRSALDGWIESGGLLIVGGGSGVQKTVAGLPRDVLPVRVGGTAPVTSLDGLGKLVGKPFAEHGPWLVGDAVMASGVQLAEQDGITLFAAGRHGLGSVVYLGLDPTTEPLRGSPGEETLWKQMLSYAPSPASSTTGNARPLTGWGRQPRVAIADIGGFRQDPPLWLLYLLTAYALVVGPVNYLILRRVGRLEWSLGTIPLATLLFAGLAFAGSRANPATDAVVTDVSVLRSYDGQTAIARSFVGLFALRDLSLDLALPSGSLISPQFYPYPIDSPSQARPQTWGLDVGLGEQPSIRQFSVRSGGLATIAIDGTRSLPGRLDSQLTVDGTSVTGRITSRLTRQLKWAGLIVGSTVLRLGDIRPNEALLVSFDVSTAATDPSAIVRQLYPTDVDQSPPDEGPLRDLLQAVLNTNPTTGPRVELDSATLVGWIDEAPGSGYAGSARARPIRRTLLIASVPLRAAPGRSAQVPPGLIARRALTASSTARTQSGELTLSSGDSLSFEYRLPFDSSQLAVDGLRLDLTGTVRLPSVDQGSNPLANVSTTFLYDWQRAQWVQIEVAFGQNQIDAPERFVSPLGIVRLRFGFRPPQGQQSSSLAFQVFELVVTGQPR